MATAVNRSIPQTYLAHVFEQLAIGLVTPCELCQEQQAVFHWTEQRVGTIPHKQRAAVCRVCAGMILLVGENQ
jgi:hypothetical protein